jgi:hypothetical protein
MGYTVTVKEALYDGADYILLAQDGVPLAGFCVYDNFRVSKTVRDSLNS